MEGNFKDHPVHPPCHGQGHLFLNGVAQSPIQPDFRHLQGWGVHNFCSTTFRDPFQITLFSDSVSASYSEEQVEGLSSTPKFSGCSCHLPCSLSLQSRGPLARLPLLTPVVCDFCFVFLAWFCFRAFLYSPVLPPCFLIRIQAHAPHYFNNSKRPCLERKSVLHPLSSYSE